MVVIVATVIFGSFIRSVGEFRAARAVGASGATVAVAVGATGASGATEAVAIGATGASGATEAVAVGATGASGATEAVAIGAAGGGELMRLDFRHNQEQLL